MMFTGSLKPSRTTRPAGGFSLTNNRNAGAFLLSVYLLRDFNSQDSDYSVTLTWMWYVLLVYPVVYVGLETVIST